MVSSLSFAPICNWPTTSFEISLRGLTRNPEMYDDPESFRPERFITGKPLDPKQLVFGFGRR